MIVEYIGNTYKVSLKKGKYYEPVSQKDGLYAIVDETGEMYAFPACEFVIIEA